MKPCRLFACIGLAVLILCNFGILDVYAFNEVKVPILIEGQEFDKDDVNVAMMSWDHGSTPDPVQIQWRISQLPVRKEGLQPLMNAFDYAVAYQSAMIHPTGILSLSLIHSTPIGDEGSSLGAGLAVGFLAVLRGDQLARGIAITGTLESSGRIGLVRNLDKKIMKAAVQGYRVVLVPRGQIQAPRLRVVKNNVGQSMIIREVGTIEEAYTIMTDKQLWRQNWDISATGSGTRIVRSLNQASSLSPITD
ncbi:MAG: hypothetical protein MRJ68_05515 [Nitrospira sp.]|nr:hypothetical protein [Nitrospira sp.]